MTRSLLHAIGQPLTIIRLAVEPASKAGALDAATAGDVEAQVERLETMFQHLDALARAGRGAPCKQPIVAALKRAEDILDPLLTPRGPAVHVSASPELAEAEVLGADGLMLLLAVALLHEFVSGGGPGRVSVTLTAAESHRLMLRVEGERAKESAAANQAAVVAAALGGCVTDGQDARRVMELALPLVETPPPETQSVAMVTTAREPAHGARVMLVDDELLIAEMMAELLHDHGFEVEIQGSIADALAAVAAHPPDVVVSDLNLPDGPGEVLLGRLTSDWPKVHTVALSGRDIDADVLDAGLVDMVLRKPVTAECLAAELTALLTGEAR